MTDNNSHKLALSESFERVAKVAEERAAFNAQMALRGANQALRLGLYGIIDSDDADTIATTLEAGGEVDWSEYPEGTHAALGHCQ